MKRSRTQVEGSQDLERVSLDDFNSGSTASYSGCVNYLEEGSQSLSQSQNDNNDSLDPADTVSAKGKVETWCLA